MQTWLTDDPYDPAYNIDDIEMESRLTSHMILNTRNASSIYPEDIKDAEIEIYIRNMKHAPKYEMLQFIKFSDNNDLSDNNSVMEKQKDEDFDMSVGCVNPLTNSRLLLSFKLKCEFLDHVAPDFGVPEHLPHSLFDDCSNEIDRILEIVKEKKRKGDSLWAYSPYIQEDGSMVDCKVKIIDFDFDRLEFLIEFDDKFKCSELYGYEYLRDQDINKVSKLRKYCCRSNLQLEYESKHEADERKRMVAFRRLEAQNQLNCEKAFINELANKYDYVKMGREMKENIKSKIIFDMKKFEPKSYLNNLCIQVETLYIFSILKSLLFSQFFDPNIQKIVSRYSIEELPAPIPPYYALKSYDLQKSPVEKMLCKDDAKMILKQYSLLGRQCYINIIFKLKQLNNFIINGQLFCNPITYDVMYPILQNDPEFKEVVFDEYEKMINTYPIELAEYVRVWNAVSKSFKKNTVETAWCGGIARIIEDLVYQEFDSNVLLTNLTRNRLNPFIIKLMEMCRLRMETELADKYSDTLEQYLKTLIKFVARDSDFFENNPQYLAQGINRYDNSNHFTTPMIKCVVKIKKFKDRDESGSKYDLYTKPSLMNI